MPVLDRKNGTAFVTPASCHDKAIHTLDNMNSTIRFVRGEFVKKLGQAPRIEAYSQRFRVTGSEPVPFFHSPRAKDDIGSLCEQIE